MSSSMPSNSFNSSSTNSPEELLDLAIRHLTGTHATHRMLYVTLSKCHFEDCHTLRFGFFYYIKMGGYVRPHSAAEKL